MKKNNRTIVMALEIIAIILSLILIALALTGCKNKETESQTPDSASTEQIEDSSDNNYDDMDTEDEMSDAEDEDTLATPPVLTEEEPVISEETGMAVGYYIATGVNEYDLFAEDASLDGCYIRLDEDGTGEICMGDMLEDTLIPFSYSSTEIVDDTTGEVIPITYSQETKSITVMIDGEEETFAFTFTYAGSEMPEENAIVSEIENFDPMVVDDEVFSMYVLEDSTENGTYMWRAIVTNKTDRDLYILPAYGSVNGCSVKPDFNAALLAGEDAEVTLRWKADDLSVYGITSVDVINMGISVLDDNTHIPVEQNIGVNVFPNGEENAKYVEFSPTAGMTALVSNQDVDVYTHNRYTDENGNVVIEFIIHNKMENPILAAISTVTIGDESIEISWADEMPETCVAVETITIPAENVQSVNGDTDPIDAALQIYNADMTQVNPIIIEDTISF